MKVNKSSMNYEILDSGVVMLYNEAADLTFHFSEGNDSFLLELRFLTDSSGQQRMEQKNFPGRTLLECYNFWGGRNRDGSAI